MKARMIASIVFWGFFLIAVGCAGPNSMTGEKKIPLTEKQPKKMNSSSPGASDVQKYVPGQVLVKLKSGMDASALDILARDLGLETVEPLALPGVYLMRINSDESVDSVVEKLKAYDMVEYGEPNYKLKTE